MGVNVLIENELSQANLLCGLIMPISSMAGYPLEHWLEVKSIISDVVKNLPSHKFNVKLVSEADEVGIIHKRIVQNLYDAQMVVCDVSGKNPNVMFELGMRLAFDKPVIIIKDDETDYTFDAGVIEHLSYPKDLRFSKILKFKEELSHKIVASYEASDGPSSSSFLKNFGTFKVAKLTEKETTADNLMLEAIADLQKEMRSLRVNIMREGEEFSDKRLRSFKNKSDLPKSLVKDLIRTWAIKENLTPGSNLVGNEKLYEYLEMRLEPQLFYRSPLEFKAFIDSILNQLF